MEILVGTIGVITEEGEMEEVVMVEMEEVVMVEMEEVVMVEMEGVVMVKTAGLMSQQTLPDSSISCLCVEP